MGPVGRGDVKREVARVGEQSTIQSKQVGSNPTLPAVGRTGVSMFGSKIWSHTAIQTHFESPERVRLVL